MSGEVAGAADITATAAFTTALGEEEVAITAVVGAVMLGAGAAAGTVGAVGTAGAAQREGLEIARGLAALAALMAMPTEEVVVPLNCIMQRQAVFFDTVLEISAAIISA